MRFLYTIPMIWLCGLSTKLRAAGEDHVIPLYAEPVASWSHVTNSMIMVWMATILIILFSMVATRKMQLVPAGVQNLAEWMVESLYTFLEGLLGPQLIRRTFWFFGSLFFLILTVNLLGLMPGVGTVGRYTMEDGHPHFIPFLRGGNADLNMTAAMAMIFFFLWFYWAISENGLKGFLAHIFAPKGGFKGIALAVMIPIFLFVGVLEVISIMIRPIALNFRLFGNMYGGEQTLEMLMMLPPPWLAFAPALPFMFIKLLVCFVQALVFTLLCSIFLKLICDHGDDHH